MPFNSNRLVTRNQVLRTKYLKPDASPDYEVNFTELPDGSRQATILIPYFNEGTKTLLGIINSQNPDVLTVATLIANLDYSDHYSESELGIRIFTVSVALFHTAMKGYGDTKTDVLFTGPKRSQETTVVNNTNYALDTLYNGYVVYDAAKSTTRNTTAQRILAQAQDTVDETIVSELYIPAVMEEAS